MTGTITLKHDPAEGKDGTVPQTIIDNEGYTWHLGENEKKTLPDDGNRTTLASNATVKWGTTTQQGDAPHVVADIEDGGGRT